MRQSRTLASPGRPGLYHVFSRIVDKRFIFNDPERHKFIRLLKDGAAFAGVDVITWCVMGNHFHVLVRVPVIDSAKLGDEEVLSRMAHLYSERKMQDLREIWGRCGTPEARRRFLGPYRARMGDLSDFVKTLKQRFTQWFNRCQNREGTLWEGRFRSVLLEHNESDASTGLGALACVVAGYIDLNPVRAGLAGSAAGSDWSGYGAALRGDQHGVAGLEILWGTRVTDKIDVGQLLELHLGFLDRGRGGGHGPDTDEMLAAMSVSVLSHDLEEHLGPCGGGSERPVKRLAARMTSRCEEFTKAHKLGRAWLAEQIR